MTSNKEIKVLAGVFVAGLLALQYCHNDQTPISNSSYSSSSPATSSHSLPRSVSSRKYSSLHPISPLDSVESNTTAYFFFQRHAISEAEPIEPATLLCQFEIYRKLEELVNTNAITNIFVESFNKNADISAEYPNLTLTPQLMGHPEAFSDGEVLDVIQKFYGFEPLFSKFYQDKVTFTGWEEKSAKEFENEVKRFQHYDELRIQVKSGSITSSSPLYQEFIVEDQAIQKYLQETSQKRSSIAYFNSLEMATERNKDHPEETNYAVVIGKAHKQDILEIAAKQESHPRIEMYECASSL